MSRKLTYEFVKESFEKEGYVLLSKEYVHSKSKLNYRCTKGHVHSIIFNSWQQGKRCPICAGNTKPSLEEIEESFKKEGYILLSKEYENAFTKLDYRCSESHRHSICWHDWKRGYRCPHCYGNAKYTLEYVKDAFEKEGYLLLSKEYKNSKIKLNYICPNGHKHNITWNDWISGCRCSYCVDKNIKLTLEQIKKSFDREGYTLLSEEYRNNHTKLDYVCSNGHNQSIKWNDWQQGHRCSICNYIKFSGPGNPNWSGGSSYGPYCSIWSDKKYKSDIKLRDGNKCLNPACSKKSSKLHIHHIDYDKKNCRPSNLITVCNSCNAKANTDREWHKVWYQAIIKNRYGGIS